MILKNIIQKWYLIHEIKYRIGNGATANAVSIIKVLRKSQAF
jgi:hypothetical protein